MHFQEGCHFQRYVDPPRADVQEASPFQSSTDPWRIDFRKEAQFLKKSPPPNRDFQKAPHFPKAVDPPIKDFQNESFKSFRRDLWERTIFKAVDPPNSFWRTARRLKRTLARLVMMFKKGSHFRKGFSTEAFQNGIWPSFQVQEIFCQPLFAVSISLWRRDPLENPYSEGRPLC